MEISMKLKIMLFLIFNFTFAIAFSKEEIDINKLVGKKYEEFRDQQIVKRTWKIKDKKNIKELILDAAIKFRSKNKEPDEVWTLYGRWEVYCPKVFDAARLFEIKPFESSLLYLEYIVFELPICFDLDDKKKYQFLSWNLSEIHRIFDSNKISKTEKQILEPTILINYDKYLVLCAPYFRPFTFRFKDFVESNNNIVFLKKISQNAQNDALQKIIECNLYKFSCRLPGLTGGDASEQHFLVLNFCYLYMELANNDENCLVFDNLFLRNIDMFQASGFFTNELKVSKEDRYLYLPCTNKKKAMTFGNDLFKKTKYLLQSKSMAYLNELSKEKLGIEILIQTLRERKIENNLELEKLHKELISKLESYKDLTEEQAKIIVKNLKSDPNKNSPY
jgi:hypothetical protein